MPQVGEMRPALRYRGVTARNTRGSRQPARLPYNVPALGNADRPLVLDSALKNLYLPGSGMPLSPTRA
jgi:hypothetical protein